MGHLATGCDFATQRPFRRYRDFAFCGLAVDQKFALAAMKLLRLFICDLCAQAVALLADYEEQSNIFLLFMQL